MRNVVHALKRVEFRLFYLLQLYYKGDSLDFDAHIVGGCEDRKAPKEINTSGGNPATRKRVYLLQKQWCLL